MIERGEPDGNTATPRRNRTGAPRKGAIIEHVIYVHGLFMTGADGLLLRRRLARDFGFRVHLFHYRSVSTPMCDVTEKLAEFARELAVERLHFVGHSLGGLVIYRTLERFADLPSGRVVFLGTPAVASRAAVGIRDRLRWASGILGKCVAEELLTERSRRWDIDRPLGIIAGTRPAGLGQFFARLDGESDGTISVSETKLRGASDHLTVPSGHMGLLMSARVARQTGAFLRNGQFSLS